MHRLFASPPKPPGLRAQDGISDTMREESVRTFSRFERNRFVLFRSVGKLSR